LRLAGTSAIDCLPVDQPAAPPDADPHVRWYDRESGRPPTYVDFRSMFTTPRKASVPPKKYLSSWGSGRSSTSGGAHTDNSHPVTRATLQVSRGRAGDVVLG